jgi:hypothetical protein
VDDPIWLVGTGRCGSSLLLRLLSYHPSLAWQSHLSARVGGWAGAFARVHDVPGLADVLPRAEGRRWIPQATENYTQLEAATDHRFTAPRELRADELTPADRERLRGMVADHLRAQGKPRFVMKHTGFPRVAYLAGAFPEARFVHVVRDGRAVAVSLCQVDWWSGEGQWGWGPIDEDDRRTYADSGRHELVLAAIYWKTLMRHHEGLVAPGRTQLRVLRYDAMVRAHVDALEALAAWAGLPPSDVFRRRLAATPMTSDDTRWRKRVTADEAKLLERVLAPTLARWGFDP